MKKKNLVGLLCSLFTATALMSGVSYISTKAEGEIGHFESSNTSITVTTNGTGITTAKGNKGESFTLNYNKSVDFTKGASFQYVIPTVKDMSVNAEARSNGNNYIKVSAIDDSNCGVEFKIYAINSNSSIKANKMDIDVTYLNPSIQKGEDGYTEDGRKYLETFTSYTNVFDARHTIDIHKEKNMWFFAVDGLTTIPVTSINKELTNDKMDNCTVTMEVFSNEVNPNLKVFPVKEGIQKNYIINDFLNFGSDVVVDNADDTKTYAIKDKRAVEFPGQFIRYREQLIDTVGYDVRKPITIDYSYDVSNASAVWYAIGLGRSNVLDTISKRQYDILATNSELKSDYSDSIILQNDGIMFQTGTGLAQPSYAEQNGRLSPYKTNSKSKPYSSREDMDKLTFIVKEEGTDMYLNGDLIFDNLVTKLSDFADNDYKAYPYFHFFEDVASAEKGNKITINGINVASRLDDKKLKVTGGTNEDLKVLVDSKDYGDITLMNNVDGKMVEVDKSLYSYNKENNELTIKYNYFDGKEFDVYKLYAKNHGGSAEIEVRFSDPALVTIPPTSDKERYEWVIGKEGDLEVKIDIKNGTWKSISGIGMTPSKYTIKEEGTNVTVTIKGSHLNTKKAGIYTCTIKTTNVEEEIFESTFKIWIKNSDNDVDPEKPVNPDTSENNDKKGGCGSVMGSGLAITGILGLGVVFVLKKKKN